MSSCCNTYHVTCSHRYGLKGAVYLKDREGQVVSVDEDGRCEWKAGTLQRYPDRISTCTSTGTHTFYLFDHITVSKFPANNKKSHCLWYLYLDCHRYLLVAVFSSSSCVCLPPQVRISVEPSRCHADSLCLQLIRNKPHCAVQPESQPAGRGRSELVQEVVRWAEEASLQAEEEKGRKSKLSREERKFRQSRTPNLYVLLQEISELALLDLSLCQIRNTEEQICTASS